LRIDWELKFGRKWRGPDTARSRLEKSFGSAFLQEFLERGEFLVGNILFRNVTCCGFAIIETPPRDEPMLAHIGICVPFDAAV
jgi:hypothetical protein